MAEHSRTLHFQRESQTSGVRLYTTHGTVTNPTVITGASTESAGTLYTTAADETYPALRVKDGNTTVYAPLVEASGTAEGLMVSANGKNYVTFPPKGKALNEYTWDEISQISLAGKGSEYFNIGDCKEITLNGKVGDYLTLSNTKLCVFILDINHPMNGTAENNIIFGGFKTALTNGTDVALADDKYHTSNLTNGTICFNMNHWGNNNYGGWKGCDMRYDILGATSTQPSDYGKAHTTSCVGYDATAATLTNPKADTLLAALPSDLRSNMRLWTRYVDAVGNKSNVDANIKATVDAITMLNEPEVIVSRYNANTYEYSHNTQMAYYVNGDSRIKKNHSDVSSGVYWWESSPRSGSASGLCCFTPDGGNSAGDGNYSFAIAPAFKI